MNYDALARNYDLPIGKVKVSLRDDLVYGGSKPPPYEKFVKKALFIGMFGVQNRDEFETFKKARSWAVLFVLPCREARAKDGK